MRSLAIRLLIPTTLCALPILAVLLVVSAIPSEAANDYLARFKSSPMDWLIVSIGLLLLIVQTRLAWRALQWQTTGFDQAADRRLSTCAQAAEWFPLLGLLGTVAGILQTFGSIGPTVTPQEIIRKYAPAITATGSGLLMALVNILPAWSVNLGRELILALGGHAPGDAAEGD
jgi:hypothetical protein